MHESYADMSYADMAYNFKPCGRTHNEQYEEFLIEFEDWIDESATGIDFYEGWQIMFVDGSALTSTHADYFTANNINFEG